jgi:hypothetical protein
MFCGIPDAYPPGFVRLNQGSTGIRYIAVPEGTKIKGTPHGIFSIRELEGKVGTEAASRAMVWGRAGDPHGPCDWEPASAILPEEYEE